MSEPAIDQEEVEPRLLLVGPASLVLNEKARNDLPGLLNLLRPAALLLSDAGRGSLGELGHLRNLANRSGAAFLLEDKLDLIAGADGLHFREGAAVKAARKKLGKDDLIGADAGHSRHDAMTIGEDGADYVAFGDRDAALTDETLQHVRWWRAMTVLPCLAYAPDLEAVKALYEAGADFIGVSSLVFDHQEIAGSTARELAGIFESS